MASNSISPTPHFLFFFLSPSPAGPSFSSWLQIPFRRLPIFCSSFCHPLQRVHHSHHGFKFHFADSPFFVLLFVTLSSGSIILIMASNSISPTPHFLFFFLSPSPAGPSFSSWLQIPFRLLPIFCSSFCHPLQQVHPAQDCRLHPRLAAPFHKLFSWWARQS